MRLTSSSGSSNATNKRLAHLLVIEAATSTSAAPARIFSSSACRSASSSAGAAGAPICRRAVLTCWKTDMSVVDIAAISGGMAASPKSRKSLAGRVRHLVDRAVEACDQRFDGARIAQYGKLPCDYLPTYFFTLGLTQQCEERLKVPPRLASVMPASPHELLLFHARNPGIIVFAPQYRLCRCHDARVAVSPERLERSLNHGPIRIGQ